MKKFKKMMALALAMVMVLAMSLPAFAAATAATETGTGKITVTQGTNSVTLNDRVFRAYKILDIQSHSEAYDKIAYTIPDNMMPFFKSNTATGLNIASDVIPSGNTTTAAFDNAVTKALSAMADDSDAIKAFAEKAQAWCKDNGQYYTATGANNKVEFTNIPLGYYIVDDQTVPDETTNTAVSAVILDTTTPEQTIVVKASTVPSDKEITGFDTGETGEDNVTSRQLYKKDTTGTVYDVSDVSIGDIVHFQVDSKVPDTRGYNYYKFVVNDTLDKGFKLDKSTIKVKIGDDEYTATNGGIDVTVTPDPSTGEGSTTLKIVLKNALQKFTFVEDATNGTYYKDGNDYKTPLPDEYAGTKYRQVAVGTDIKITYDAELTKDAPVGTKVENHVTIDYTNNPKVDVDHSSDDFTQNDPKGTTPEEKTETFTTELTIFKVDENNNPLTGAEFTLTGTSANKVVTKKQVFTEAAATTFAEGAANAGKAKYWKLADGTYTQQDPNTPNATDATKPAYDLSKYADYKDGDVLASAANYKTYVLSDTSAVTDEENTDQKVVVTTDANGVVTFTGLSEGTYHIEETVVPDGYNGLDPIDVHVSFSYDGTANNNAGAGTFAITAADKTTGWVEDGDNTFSIRIQNNKGVELPSTGGMGTTIFYIIGAVLVLGAGILLVTRRRMNAN